MIFIEFFAFATSMIENILVRIIKVESFYCFRFECKLNVVFLITLLYTALDFLSTSGTVVPVKIRGGRQLIILDPLWLCRFLFDVTQISTYELREQKCPFSILKRLSQKYDFKDLDDFIQLIEGLEVAIPVDRNRYVPWYKLLNILNHDRCYFDDFSISSSLKLVLTLHSFIQGNT